MFFSSIQIVWKSEAFAKTPVIPESRSDIRDLAKKIVHTLRFDPEINSG